METYSLKNELTVFGTQVKSFPSGIGEAFEILVNKVGGFNRSFYGISRMDGNCMIYVAAALEIFEGEAAKQGCEKYTVEAGEYLVVTIHDWRSKTACIKDVFHEMMQDERAGTTYPCVEWYRNDDEMMCMVKMIPQEVN